MNSIVLIGAGGHCKSVIDVIEEEGRFKIAGILDKPKLLGTKTLGWSGHPRPGAPGVPRAPQTFLNPKTVTFLQKEQH